MKVFIERTKRTVDANPGLVIDVLKELDLSPDDVLVTKNGELVTEDEPLGDSDDVKVLSVVSGG